MKRLLAVACLFGLLASLVGQAAAEDKKPEKKAPDPEAVFKKMDADADGKVSLEEFKANKKGKALENAEKQFTRIDKNSDKSVDLEEFKASRAPKKPKKDKAPE